MTHHLDEARDKDLIAGWYERAAKIKSTEELKAFMDELLAYGHDYGTICHAIGASMCAALWAVNASPSGGITGFQAGCIKWLVLEKAFYVKSPARLLDYNDLLYPQMSDKFTSITPETWAEVQAKAREQLAEIEKEELASPSVISHMRSVVEGVVPFGLRVVAD